MIEKAAILLKMIQMRWRSSSKWSIKDIESLIMFFMPVNENHTIRGAIRVLRYFFGVLKFGSADVIAAKAEIQTEKYLSRLLIDLDSRFRGDE